MTENVISGINGKINTFFHWWITAPRDEYPIDNIHRWDAWSISPCIEAFAMTMVIAVGIFGILQDAGLL